jgi:3-phytase
LLGAIHCGRTRQVCPVGIQMKGTSLREKKKLLGVTAVLLPVVLAAGGQVALESGQQAASVVASAIPTVQTPPAFYDDAGGRADSDDPEVWLHPGDSKDSVVLGTEKENGLKVFDLDGKMIQHLPAPPPPRPGDEKGRINNIDVVYGAEAGGSNVDIAVSTDRGLDKLHVYSIDPHKAAERTAPLTEITDPSAPYLFSANQDEVNGQNTAYGVAAWKAGDGTVYVLATREHRTAIALVRLVPRPGGKMGYEPVRTVSLPASFVLPNGASWTPCDKPGREPQSEGMVVDVERNLVYVSQERVGVWRMPATLAPFTPQLIDKVKGFGIPGTYNPVTDECVPGADPGFGGRHLSADVEGQTIYHRGDGEGYLISSSQGDSTYAVYDLVPGNAYIGSFRVTNGKGDVDSTENTDSLFAVNAPVGPFTQGLLLVQDGNNIPAMPGPDGKPRMNTNFKFVPWQNVASGFSPPLKIDADGFDPQSPVLDVHK